MAIEQIGKGDVLTEVEFELTDPDDGTPVDLTGATIVAKYRITPDGGSPGATKTLLCTSSVPTSGKCRINPRSATDFDVAGVAKGSTIHTISGKPGIARPFEIRVFEVPS